MVESVIDYAVTMVCQTNKITDIICQKKVPNFIYSRLIHKRNMETNSGEGDERMRPDMEHHHQMGCRPTAVALSC